MSASPQSSNSNEPTDGRGPVSSPAPGCIIIITILVVFGGLAILYTVVAILQNRGFDEFTDEEPAERELFETSPEQIRTATRKTEDLLLASTRNEMDRLLFTADDLNTLIATRELLADFRGTTFVRKITEDGIEAEMSQPVRTGFLGSDRFRYLNATFVFKPILKDQTLLFHVVDIRSENPERPVPVKFVDGYARLEFFKLDSSNQDLAPALKKLGSVYLEEDKVAVETRVVILR